MWKKAAAKSTMYVQGLVRPRHVGRQEVEKCRYDGRGR